MGGGNTCLLKQDENEKFNPLERYLNYLNELKGKAEIVYQENNKEHINAFMHEKGRGK